MVKSSWYMRTKKYINNKKWNTKAFVELERLLIQSILLVVIGLTFARIIPIKSYEHHQAWNTSKNWGVNRW